MTRTEQTNAAAAAFLARHDSGAWSAADQNELDQWLDQDTAHRVAWLRLQSVWQRADRLRATAPARVVTVAAAARRLPRWTWLTAVGTAAAASVAAVTVWLQLLAPAGVQRYSTAIGARAAIQLGDGSQLMLNTRTRARALVNDQERRVWLDEGEAFFEVQPDPQHPFVVVAGTRRITVLGTKFRVRNEDGRMEVTVVDGKVRLDRIIRRDPWGAPPAITDGAGPTGRDGAVEPETGILLVSNDAAVVDEHSVLRLRKSPQQVLNELSWREGRLVFDERTLAEIAAEFNRYNHIQLQVDPSVADLRLSGNFAAGDVRGFARLLQLGFGINAAQQGEQLRLWN